MRRNDPIFNPLPVQRNMNKTGPVQIPDIKGAVSQIDLKWWSKNSNLEQFCVSKVMWGYTALVYALSYCIKL